MPLKDLPAQLALQLHVLQPGRARRRVQKGGCFKGSPSFIQRGLATSKAHMHVVRSL